MSQGIASLHKILKDETRQKIILLLNEKGNLSYTDLMDRLEVVSTGLLNYHLKVLADLITKNEFGQYTLTEKGQLAYKVLTEFSTNQPQIIDKRIIKTWIVFTIASIIIALITGIFSNIPLENTLTVITIILIANGFGIYIRLKPSKSGNRAFFIFVGASILGFLLWAMVIMLMNSTGISVSITRHSGQIGSYFAWIASIIICWIIGGFIGDVIGRRRNYVIPMLRV